jgi:hypothetical protein
MEGFMKGAVEMGSSVMIYIPTSIKIGSGIQNLTHKQHGDLMGLVFF